MLVLATGMALAFLALLFTMVLLVLADTARRDDPGPSQPPDDFTGVREGGDQGGDGEEPPAVQTPSGRLS